MPIATEAAARYPQVLWDNVQLGDDLPAITYELSLLRLVAFVRASGLYDYVHFDGEYARAAGSRDAFISTPHIAGLFSRLLTDWTGPGANIRSIEFRINGQSCANDILHVSGKVMEKSELANPAAALVHLDLNIAHERSAQAVTGKAIVELPSRANPSLVARTRRFVINDKPVNPRAPQAALRVIGIERPLRPEPGMPLTPGDLALWCEALEDWNPLYWNAPYANASRFGGLIAPPAGMFAGPGTSSHMGVGYLKPGTDIPAPLREGLTGLALTQALRRAMGASQLPVDLPQHPEIVVTNAKFEYFESLRPGDTAAWTQRLIDCSEEKVTRLGTGHFVTVLRSLSNQDGKLIKTFIPTLFQYHT